MSLANGSTSINTESPAKIRKLETTERSELCSILSPNKSWHALAGVIRNPCNKDEYLYTADDISLIESQKQPVQCLLEDWGTRGVEQATVIDLLECLKEANLLRAVKFVQTELLRIPGDTDEGDTSEIFSNAQEEENQEIQDAQWSHVAYIRQMLEDIDMTGIALYPYEVLKIATSNFSEDSLENDGCMIGKGAFGTVFRAVLSDVTAAIKRLEEPLDRQFFTELSTLVSYKHENLLPLLGCSFDGQFCCLVYKYMPNGSLQERLACPGHSRPLSAATRFSIAHGSAVGINFLHTFGEVPMVHRDIKSANILLDESLTPKIGDFGLVKTGGTMTRSYVETENVCGTRMYMPYEAFGGDVSPKLDAYSFGVVLLELLTGLPPYDKDRDGNDLVTHMENFDDILDKLDEKVQWDTSLALELYRIAKLCLVHEKKNRAKISDVLPDLKRISNFQCSQSE